MRENGDEDQVVMRLLVELPGDLHLRPFVLRIDDAAVAPQLFMPDRAGPGEDGHVVSAARLMDAKVLPIQPQPSMAIRSGEDGWSWRCPYTDRLWRR